MRETGKWGEELGVATVGELNELITGKTNKNPPAEILRI